jgi:hypothetical protein
MQRKINGALLALIMTATVAAPAMARKNDLIIKDGQGEEVQIKHGFFGRGTTVVKDRMGNGYATHTGFFGTKDQQIGVLGNTFERKKGLLGGSTINGSTIFGDKVQTRKGIFGRRTTTVDVSGTSNVLKTLWQQHGAQLMGKMPGQNITPNMAAPGVNAPAAPVDPIPPATSNVPSTQF